MAKKSKLLLALDFHKGRNFKLEHQKKHQKAAAKRKIARLEREANGNEFEIERQTVCVNCVIDMAMYTIIAGVSDMSSLPGARSGRSVESRRRQKPRAK
jgi:hypothetical protein